MPVVILKSFSEIKNPIYKITYYMDDGVNPSIVDYLKENLSDNLSLLYLVISG